MMLSEVWVDFFTRPKAEATRYIKLDIRGVYKMGSAVCGLQCTLFFYQIGQVRPFAQLIHVGELQADVCAMHNVHNTTAILREHNQQCTLFAMYDAIYRVHIVSATTKLRIVVQCVQRLLQCVVGKGCGLQFAECAKCGIHTVKYT